MTNSTTTAAIPRTVVLPELTELTERLRAFTRRIAVEWPDAPVGLGRVTPYIAALCEQPVSAPLLVDLLSGAIDTGMTGAPQAMQVLVREQLPGLIGAIVDDSTVRADAVRLSHIPPAVATFGE